MDASDCRALLGHAEWSDSVVWKAVLALDQQDAVLRETLHHLHLVQWSYLHIWREEPVKPRELATFPRLSAIRGWACEYYRELTAYLAGLPAGTLSREVRFPWADRVVQQFGSAKPASWTETVVQVAMHSSHHRGQVARRVRELGGESPVSDFIAWIWLGRPGADWGGEDAA